MPQMPTCLITDLIVKTPGRYCRCRLYWTLDTPITSATNMVTLANQVFANYSGSVSGILAATCQFWGVYVKYTDPSMQLDAYSTTAAVNGQNLSVPLPDETCAEIQRRTNLAGRQNRGRVFFSGLPVSSQDDGVLTTSFIAFLQTLAGKIGPDQTFAIVGVAHARHYDRKDNVLRGVSQCRVSNLLVSRRDRRAPRVIMAV